MRTYKIERKMVPKSVATRRSWAKFGMSKGDKPGPNPQTTVVAEEIWMYFVANKDENQKDEQDDAMSKIWMNFVANKDENQKDEQDD